MPGEVNDACMLNKRIPFCLPGEYLVRHVLPHDRHSIQRARRQDPSAPSEISK
jgi:hypothetical protein